MRKDRMGLIQTPDQLRFSYQAIIEGMKKLDPSWVRQPTFRERVAMAFRRVRHVFRTIRRNLRRR